MKRLVLLLAALFVSACSAPRPEPGDAIQTEAQAREIAAILCQRDYPKDRGWTNWSASYSKGIWYATSGVPFEVWSIDLDAQTGNAVRRCTVLISDPA
jgi:hypothetical protein